MKSLTLFSFAFIALTIGCDNAPAQNDNYGNHQMHQAIPVNQNNSGVESSTQQGGYAQANPSRNNGSDEIKMHPIMNAQTGQPSMYIPFPTSWKFTGAAPGQPSTTGPNGLVITIYPPQSYIYTNDPYLQQALQSNGQHVIAPVGIEVAISQQLIPQGQQMGMTLIKQYPLPQIAAKDAEYANKLYGSNPQQNVFQAAGTEWNDANGNKILVVLHYNEMRSSAMINWGYTVDMLKVQPAYFEKTKNQYIYGMSNKVYNQNEVNAFNNQLAAKLKADNDNFQAIQKINTDGARQRAEMDRQTTEYINNSNQASYEYRQHNNDMLHEQTVNTLTDVEVVISPYDGKEYQVESGSTTYWINDEGKYIQSDDPLYDPNKYETHPGVWQQAPLKVYK